MPDFATLILFGSALAAVASTPGPTTAAITARVLTGGIGAVLPFLIALWVGEIVWLTGAVLGLSAFAAHYAEVFTVIKWLGVAYLLYLALQMWRAEPKIAGKAELPAPGSARRMFLGGLAVSFGNPKVMVFYVALLPGLVDLANVTLGGWLALIATMTIVLAVVDLAWALAADRARLMLRTPRAVRIANRLGATAMGGAAAAIAAR